MAIALAVATSMIKVVKLPMGGSVTLFSMLFIVLIGYWYGIKTGLTAPMHMEFCSYYLIHIS